MGCLERMETVENDMVVVFELSKVFVISQFLDRFDSLKGLAG